MVRRAALRVATLAIGLTVLAGCATERPADPGASAGAAGRLEVVAAENFWGSIAAQIGGADVRVTSLIDSPDADPHDYEPTARDARLVDSADVVIGNGIGYDPWFGQLVASLPDRPVEIDVGDVAGLSAGDNPHQWYSPATVLAVVDRIAQAYTEADPDRASVFAAGRDRFVDVTLAPYRALIADIRVRFGGVPVGASESIFAPLADALGLDLLTPQGFLAAVSEGADPTAADKATVDRQIESGRIAMWVYNEQNATPDVARLTEAARRAGLPIVTITETPTPAGVRFQDWQCRQLREVRDALARTRAVQ
jgi:zinc/manganese transport system substrate-binding protein